MHTLTGRTEGVAMKDDIRLGAFITFILLAATPKNRSAAVSDFIHIQLAIPQLLPLTQFMRIALDSIREHDISIANEAAPAELVFRFGTNCH
jgi:hypothetical protein